MAGDTTASLNRKKLNLHWESKTSNSSDVFIYNRTFPKFVESQIRDYCVNRKMVRKEEMEIGQSEWVAGERPQGKKRFNVKYNSNAY